MAGDCEDRPEDKFAGVLHPRARSVWRNRHSDWRGRRPTSRPPQFVHIGPQIARPHSAAFKCQFKAYLSTLTFGSSVERPTENPPTPAFQLTRRAVFDCLGPLVVARAHGRGRSAPPFVDVTPLRENIEDPTAGLDRTGAFGRTWARICEGRTRRRISIRQNRLRYARTEQRRRGAWRASSGPQ